MVSLNIFRRLSVKVWRWLGKCAMMV